MKVSKVLRLVLGAVVASALLWAAVTVTQAVDEPASEQVAE
jgi:hypothetical protein